MHSGRLISFNRRGDSLGGAAGVDYGVAMGWPVSIAGAILWGVLPRYTKNFAQSATVSIAGAILWGVLPIAFSAVSLNLCSFNRRGDSLGGAASVTKRPRRARPQFQSQGRFFGGCCNLARRVQTTGAFVSIAGAILWGVLLPSPAQFPPGCEFQSQGRFFGGCCPGNRTLSQWS